MIFVQPVKYPLITPKFFDQYKDIGCASRIMNTDLVKVGDCICVDDKLVHYILCDINASTHAKEP